MRRKIDITGDAVAADGDIATDQDAENGSTGANSAGDVGEASAHVASHVPEETAAYITALQAELEDVRARLEGADKRLLYAQAEFQNVLRRRDEQYRADQKYANGEIIKSLLPILDNFDRALKAAEQTRSFDSLIGGVSGTLKQLLTFLEKAGVIPIETVG